MESCTRTLSRERAGDKPVPAVLRWHVPDGQCAVMVVRHIQNNDMRQSAMPSQ